MDNINLENTAEMLYYGDDEIREQAIDTFRNKYISVDTIKRGLSDKNENVRCAAMEICSFCLNSDSIPADIIEIGLKDENKDVRFFAMLACSGTNFSRSIIKRWLNSSEWEFRVAAMYACTGRADIPFKFIKRGFNDDNVVVRQAALKACYCRKDVPLEFLERGMCDEASNVKRVAKDFFYEARSNLKSAYPRNRHNSKVILRWVYSKGYLKEAADTLIYWQTT